MIYISLHLGSEKRSFLFFFFNGSDITAYVSRAAFRPFSPPRWAVS